jgi:hypothetical protein
MTVFNAKISAATLLALENNPIAKLFVVVPEADS